MLKTKCPVCRTDIWKKGNNVYCSVACRRKAYGPKLRARQADRRRELKARLITEAGGECADCGIVGPPCIYDFHHKDPRKKEVSVSQMSGYKEKRIREEVKKTVLLCSNCHRIRHHGKEQ